MNIEELKEVALNARKTKDPNASLYILIIGEVETLSKRDGKSITPELITQVIKKMAKSVDEVLKVRPGDTTAKIELDILQAMLPKVAVFERDVIADVIHQGAKNIGAVMKELNALAPEGFDKAAASKIAKELLG